MRRILCLGLICSAVLVVIFLSRIPHAQAKAPNVVLFFPSAHQSAPLQPAYVRLNIARYAVFYIVGEMRNTSQETLGDVRLEVRVSVSGTLTRTYTVDGLLPAVFSGETMPFQIQTDLNPNLFDPQFDIRVLSYSRDLGPIHYPLTVVTNECDGEHYVRGTVRNDSRFTLTDIQLINDSNDGTFAPTTPEKQQLAPGETMKYSGMTFFGCNPFGFGSTVKIWAQGKIEQE